MEMLLAHLFGDYLLQSDWQANSKTTKSFACLCHVLTYGLPFLLLSPSWLALLVIVGTHFFIDRFRLAKYVVYAKNFLAPPNVTRQRVNNGCTHSENCNCGYETADKYKWENCQATGYPSETPPFLAVWLLIIADNSIHLLCNYLALRFL